MATMNQSFALGDEQSAVFQRLEGENRHFFITGKAGTGKSVLLRYFVEHTKKRTAVLAPTGIAAIHVGGQTIHSFFCMDTAPQDPRKNEDLYQGMNEERSRMLDSLDTLIIDEISMVRADVMDMIDWKLRAARSRNIPFGGCQMIVFGDLYQLPPVARESDVQEYLTDRYGTVFFFGAPGVREAPFTLIELSTVYRQNDPAFIDMLNHIRTGNPQWEDIQALNARHALPRSRDGIITLTSRNSAAHLINAQRLEELHTQACVYTGETEGAFGEDEMPTPRLLTLRVGAEIMMLRNDPEKRWFNGSLGKVAELSDDLIRVNIGGQIYPVDQAVWIKYIYTYNRKKQSIERCAVGSFRQYPVRLAYAITIHKSQGQTFDAMILDYSDGAAFAPGQTYVALSRCRSFASLYLPRELSMEDVRVSQEIIDYMHSALHRGREPKPMLGKNMQLLQGRRFSDSAAVLPKAVRAKIPHTLRLLQEDPDLPDLRVEKIGNDGLYSARVDDTCRMIFASPEGSDLLSLLYVGPYEKAYQFANRFKVEVNPATGGLQQVEKAPKRITSEEGTGKRLSRLAALEDRHLVSMGVPEEYWPQLREKVFTASQLTGFKGLIPQEAYDTLEFVLDGTPVQEAMELWRSMTESVAPVRVEEKPCLFEAFSPDELVSVGIPADNVDKVRRIRTDKELEIIAQSLPLLAQQSLYALQGGETIEEIRKTTFSSARENPDGNLDAAVRSPITLAEFAPIHSEEALKAILEYPAEKWRVFLHPTQTEIVRQDFNGPARIVGGAGTGKTVVIVHRAKRLASECTGNEKILVTTFGNTLKYDIDLRVRDICTEEERQHISVMTVDKLTMDLARRFLNKRIAYSTTKGTSLTDVWDSVLKDADAGHTFDSAFCLAEWCDVIQSQNITSPEIYLTVSRYGRGKQLDRASREKFWKLSRQYMAICDRMGIRDADWAQNELVGVLLQKGLTPYLSVIVDECQDLRAPALRMLRTLAGEQRRNDMYLSGDTRQRIYGGRVSLSQCGIHINNRSRLLKLNYRTTCEIYNFAMQLQRDYLYDDMDGKSMSRDLSTCIFHGPAPFVRRFLNPEEESREMIRDIRNLIASGVLPSDIAIMVRSNPLLGILRGRLERNGLQVLTISNTQPDDKSIPGVRLLTMHRGKGMEYTYVYLPCLCDNVIPGRHDLESAEGDPDRLSEVLQTEANLLSVAITRAKRQVWLSYYGNPSELLRRYI